jgi:Xaa-Pro aminopeptidase
LYQIIEKQFEMMKSKVVGFEDDTITVAQFNMLKTKLNGYEFVPASEAIAMERIVKTEVEIVKIAEAENVTQKALEEVIPQIKVGMSEKEVSDMITYAMLKNGAQGLAFENVVCFGETSACPHHKPSADVLLNKNDIILVDIGARVNGYCGDMTRTFCLGQPNARLAKMHKIVLEAQLFALKNIKAGITCREADSIAREYLIAHGFKNEFSHSLGHGIGIQVHERPFVSPRSEEVLRENMIISVEPGVYIDGLGGIRIEDIVVVKNDCVINLTNNISKEMKI